MSDGLLRSWIEPQPQDVPADLQSEVGGHPLVAQILARRGIRDIASARAFLDPARYTPTAAETLPGMTAACERIERAIRDREPICVWGDFDVDGQTSTTLLVQALRGLGADVVYHIPVRARESHGVNWEHLEPILQQGARLVVTCDTGISAHEALEKAREAGVDVVITDHHDLPETLPPAYAAVNPKLAGTDHPLSGLPGVGVAYKLAEALYNRANRAGEADALLDLAALGIVADLATQTADTRYLLQRGLGVLRETRREGLKQMVAQAGIQAGSLSEEHIGFVLGPRLNALGRLDDANPAVELLTTTDEGRARVLATHLEGLNARRRLLTEQVLRGALAQIEKDPSLLEQAALVLAHPEWPAGVIGIVASELAERYNRPTVLLSTPPGQPARGSARSIEGVNISAAIGAQKHLLLGYGGHPMAAGLSLEADKIGAFRRGLSKYVEKELGGRAPRPTLAIDGYLTLPDLSLALVADLERLAPFGPGNPPLVLAVPGVQILSATTIGREGDHLQIAVRDEADCTQKVIWWRGAGWPLPEGVFDLACVLRASNYRGQREVQVEWVDARPCEGSAVELRQPIAILDQRNLDHPLPVLQSLLADQPGALVWAQGDAVSKLGIPCFSTSAEVADQPAETLILWTTPPGRAELQSVLETVKPQNVVVFAVDPSDATPEAFLKRLAGLAKYAMEKLSGRAALARLAAATAQREATVRLGLKWLEARGMCKVSVNGEGEITLEPGQPADPNRANTLLTKIRVLVEETAAYRHYFRTADEDYIL